MSKNEPLSLEVFDNPEFGQMRILREGDKYLLGMIELLFISALFGSVLIETIFDWFYAILKGFVQS